MSRLRYSDFPKALRIASWVLFAIAMFLAVNEFLTFGDQQTLPERMLAAVVILGIGLALGGALMLGYAVFYLTGIRAAREQCGMYFRKSGFCIEMADCVAAAVHFPNAEDTVMTLFFQTMSEHYDAAGNTLTKLGGMKLTPRQRAAQRTCVLYIMAMTGGLDRAEAYFQSYEAEQEFAYVSQPELLEQKLSVPELRDLSEEFGDFTAAAKKVLNTHRHWLDDTLYYYAIAAVLSRRLGDSARVEKYQALYEERLQCYRKPAEQHYRGEALALALTYGGKDLPRAKEMEERLKFEMAKLVPPLPLGVYNNITRMTHQARVYAAEGGSRDKKKLTERQYPES